ncbi:MAG: hydrolase family protein [Ilumatobacteraceae bacterium]|nr:hydrolase family protein [Ilumatobacteraceae bacterium]
MGYRFANVDGRAALIHRDHYYDVATISNGSLPSDPMDALRHAAELSTLSSTLTERKAAGLVADVVLGPPVPRPQKSFGIGLNYADHAAEGSMQVSVNPLVFTKFPSCLVGPTADVELRSDFCDYEGELVVVIGSGGKDIPVDDAWHHVAGVTVGQDISDRAVQFAANPPHFDLGKSFDTFGPIGPMLVSTDAIVDFGALRVVTSVNGEERQNDTVANLIFDVPTLIAYLSQITTLVTGDLIFTGTPAGVGAAQGKFLADGDVIVTTIDEIGSICNSCVRVSDHHSPGDRRIT